MFGRRVLLGALADMYAQLAVATGALATLFLYKLWDRSLGTFAVVLANIVGALLLTAFKPHIRRVSADLLSSADPEAKRDATRALALSLAYLIDLKRRYRWIRALLVVGILVLMLKAGLHDMLTPLEIGAVRMVFVLGALLGLTLLMELVVEVRIWKGWFGTAEWEARELVRFLVSNAAEIDFFDEDGKRRRVLLPDSPEDRQSVPVGVRDGVAT